MWFVLGMRRGETEQYVWVFHLFLLLVTAASMLLLPLLPLLLLLLLPLLLLLQALYGSSSSSGRECVANDTYIRCGDRWTAWR